MTKKNKNTLKDDHASINVAEMMKDCEELAFSIFTKLDNDLYGSEAMAIASKYKLPERVIINNTLKYFEEYLKTASAEMQNVSKDCERKHL
tara:strand:- start:313 stop:585 length:273 start_codon:yes stop_codon:yes gene_type:complete